MNSIRNVLWSLGGLGLRTVVQVVYFVLLARVLGPKEYGALSSALAIVYIFVPYATWGAGDILVRNVSRNRQTFDEYWGLALLSILIFGSIFFVLALFSYSLLLSDKVNIFPVILLCLSELFFLRIIDTTIQAYQAFELMSRTALVQFVFGLIRLIFTLLFVGLVDDHSLTKWSILYLSSTITSAMFCLFIVRRELGKARFVFSHIGNNLRDGFYFCLSPSSQSVYNDFDKSILPKYVSLGVTGNYAAAYKIIDALCVPLKALLQTFYARFFIKGAAGVAAGRKFALKLLPVFFLYSLFAVSFLVLFARYIPIVFGDSYKDATNIILLLSPVILFRAMHSLGADALTGVGLQAKRSLLQVGVAILNALLCLFLIPINGWIGAAWASLLSDGVLALLIWIMIFSATETIPPLQSHLDHKGPASASSSVE